MPKISDASRKTKTSARPIMSRACNINRMKVWRIRKMSQEAGRQTQICVWAPEHDADLVREICTRVAEATSRGEELRRSLTPQIGRRRTIYAQWVGTTFRVEIDYPFVGVRRSMLNIGGRITGSDGTHIELSPEDATDLKDRVSCVCQKEIQSWAKSRKLLARRYRCCHRQAVSGPDGRQRPRSAGR
jgi:hypothetical protein